MPTKDITQSPVSLNPTTTSEVVRSLGQESITTAKVSGYQFITKQLVTDWNFAMKILK